MKIPYGMIPAIPTPFKEDYTIDYSGIEQNLNYAIEAGVHGILVGGSTGEYSLMSMEERKSIIKFVCDVTKKRVPIMAGASCHRTEETIELTRYAREMGAESALILAPYYLPTSEQGIYDYYKKIAESSDIGIMIYHYPDATNVEMTPEQIYELSQIDGIIGIKNTTDQIHTCKVIGLTKENKNFSVLTGFEDLIVPTLSLGGNGAIGLVHNLVPKEIVQIYDLIVNDNNLEEATKVNQSLMPIYNYLEEEPVPGLLKSGLDMLGLAGGKVRDPLVPASENLTERLRTTLIELGYSVT